MREYLATAGETEVDSSGLGRCILFSFHGAALTQWFGSSLGCGHKAEPVRAYRAWTGLEREVCGGSLRSGGPVAQSARAYA